MQSESRVGWEGGREKERRVRRTMRKAKQQKESRKDKKDRGRKEETTNKME